MYCIVIINNRNKFFWITPKRSGYSHIVRKRVLLFFTICSKIECYFLAQFATTEKHASFHNMLGKRHMCPFTKCSARETCVFSQYAVKERHASFYNTLRKRLLLPMTICCERETCFLIVSAFRYFGAYCKKKHHSLKMFNVPITCRYSQPGTQYPNSDCVCRKGFHNLCE